MASVRTIRLSFPWLDEREEELVADVLRSGRLSLGPTIDRFEEAFAEVVGAPYAAAVSSGTAGLHLLCVAAGVGTGRRGGHVAVLLRRLGQLRDLRGRDAGLRRRRPAHLQPRRRRPSRRRSRDRTRAVVAVDIYGYPCELDELRAVCEARGVALIQDACEALGARYKGAPVGSQGPSAVFAFYPNKQITTGEGGMVTTHSESEWRLLRSLRNQGRADSGGWLEHARLGFNYRIDDIRAAIGLGQLEKLDDILRARADVAARYADAARRRRRGSSFRAPTTPTTSARGSSTSSTLPAGVDREAVISSLAERGIQTARYLPCIHLQPYMRERFGYRVGLCPVAEELAARTLALPFHARLAEDDQAYVADALRHALA